MADAPPHDTLAEQSLLSALLVSATARRDVFSSLLASDFYRPAHETIYDALAAIDGRGDPVDVVTLINELRVRGDLNAVGGTSYVAELSGLYVAPAVAPHYARIVRTHAAMRRLGMAGTRIVQLAHAVDGVDSASEVDAVVAAAQAEVAAVLSGMPTTDDRASTAEDILATLVASLDAPPADVDTGPDWGWLDVDRVMNPLTPGKLVVIGARPSVGKSLVLGCMAGHIAFTQGQPVLLHTMEMTRREVMQRLLARQARVELSRIVKHAILPADRARIDSAVQQMTGKALMVDESRGLTPAMLRASIRRQKPHPSVVLVDYLQLMRKGERVESRLQEVSAIARELKEIAGDESTCIVSAAQLNRGAANRPPTMSDLRESGEIEQSADDIALLHREDGEGPHMGEVSFIVAKNRQGEAGMTIQLANQAHYGRFGDLGRDLH